MIFYFLGPGVLITIILAGEKDMGNDVDFGCWNSQGPSKPALPPWQGLVELVSVICNLRFLILGFPIVDYRVAIYRLSILLSLASLSSSVHLIVCAVSL